MCEYIKNSFRLVRNNGKLALYSVFWVLFISFFTYTTLCYDLVKVGVSFIDEYYINQHRFLSLFVNVGLVCMLAFDYNSIKRPLDYKYIIIPMLLFFMAVVIMAHATIAFDNQLDTFIFPIKCSCFGVLTHALFLLGVWWLKFNVVVEAIPIGVIKGEVITKS